MKSPDPDTSEYVKQPGLPPVTVSMPVHCGACQRELWRKPDGSYVCIDCRLDYGTDVDPIGMVAALVLERVGQGLLDGTMARRLEHYLPTDVVARADHRPPEDPATKYIREALR